MCSCKDDAAFLREFTNLTPTAVLELSCMGSEVLSRLSKMPTPSRKPSQLRARTQVWALTIYIVKPL